MGNVNTDTKSEKTWSGRKRQAQHNLKLRRRGLFFAILFSCGQTASAMDEEQFQEFMTHFGQMVSQQSAASQATMQGLSNLVQSIGASAGSAASSATAATSDAALLNRNFESAAKILKSPEIFDASDGSSWQTWRHTFLNWLSYADSRFMDMIKGVEDMNPETA